MKQFKLGIIATALLMFCHIGLCQQTQAKEYPWLDNANTQIIWVTDPLVDYALRVAAINRAEHSIDSVTYLQDLSPQAGLALLWAFRDAQDRGLKGRYIYDRTASLNGDIWNRSRNFLRDRSLQSPAQVVCFGFNGKSNWGLQWTDMVHEKILIIDQGTPNEMIWIGGRNNARTSQKDLDLAYILRPIIPGQPYIGDQIKDSFENLWATTSAISPPSKIKNISNSKIAKYPRTELSELLIDSFRKDVFHRIDALIQKPVSRTPPRQVRAKTDGQDVLETRIFGRARVIRNNFLDLLLDGYARPLIEFKKNLPSDIARAAGEAIGQAQKVTFASMSIRLPKSISTGLMNALKGGATVDVLTNSRDAHSHVVVGGIPFDLGLKDMRRLLDTRGKISIYLLNEDRLGHDQRTKNFHFQHLKAIVADDHVFVGSDNFNETSRTNNDELVVQFEDAQFADQMRAYLSLQANKYYEPLTAEQAVHEASKNNLLKRILNRILLPLY